MIPSRQRVIAVRLLSVGGLASKRVRRLPESRRCRIIRGSGGRFLEEPVMPDVGCSNPLTPGLSPAAGRGEYADEPRRRAWQFSIRDVLLVMLSVGLAAGWFVDHRRMAEELKRQQNQFQ